ncbi:MAG TPA: hypothetical protein V6D18_13080 [Thermosynechococcaceae cyanobacterium]
MSKSLQWSVSRAVCRSSVSIEINFSVAGCLNLSKTARSSQGEKNAEAETRIM